MAPSLASKTGAARALSLTMTVLALAGAVLPTALAPLGAALPAGGVPLPPFVPADPVPPAVREATGTALAVSCAVLGPQMSSLNTGTTGTQYYSDISNPPGTAESKWQLTAAPAGVPLGTLAYRVNDDPSWMSTGGYPAKWISVSPWQVSLNAVAVPPGIYQYDIEVDVRCPYDFYLNFCYAADDRVEFRFGPVGSSSLGTLVPAPAYPATQYNWHPTKYCYNSYYVASFPPGLRTLRASVQNDGGPTGLWVWGYAYGT